MIWARRLKAGRDESAWAVPFADLVTLLLVVFVLIVSMSDLRPGRFTQAGHSVRDALGQALPAGLATHRPAARVSVLRERIGADLMRLTEVHLDGPDEALPSLRIGGEADQVVISVGAADAFIGPTGILAPRTRKLIARIADHLRDGRARLEVRGYGPDGVVPPGLPYLDRIDIACERARSARRELVRAGVAEDRLNSTATEEAAGGRGFDLIVFASPAGNPSGNVPESAE